MSIIIGSELAKGSLSLAIVLVVLLFGGASAQSGCTSSLLGLTPCLNYVTGNTSTPSSTCCTRLAGLIQSQPECLCVLLNGGASSYGYNINQTLALALPGVCNVQTPPVSRCNSLSPTSSPASSPPADTPDANSSTPKASAPAIPAGTATKTTPTTNAGTTPSGANVDQKLSLYSVAIALAVCLAKAFKL